MRHEVYDAVKEWRDQYLPAPGLKILEIGSYDVNGSLKGIFENQDYTGLDMLAGPNVDIVSNAHQIDIASASFDAVIYCDTFEHDNAFWLTLDEIFRLLKFKGHFIFSAPTIYYPYYHGHPDDYWRITESAFRQVVMPPSRYIMLEERQIKTANDPDTISGIGAKRRIGTNVER